MNQIGIVLNVLVQSRRDKRAARCLLRKLRQVMPGVEHRQHTGLKRRAESSHQPTRQRERQMKRFK